MLGQKISNVELKVEPTKINVVGKLPPPFDVKTLCNFLGHVGFYRRFLKDFSKIVKPLSNLLSENQPCEFDEKCNQVFHTLKDALTTTPILITLD